MTLEHVQALRRKLAVETQFDEIWDYFLTHFAEQPAFLDRGAWGPQQPLLNCILECYRRTKPGVDKALLVGFRPRDVPEFKMVHGAFQLKGEFGGFVYFTDMNMGLVCFSDLKTGQSTLGRFHVEPKAMNPGKPAESVN